MQPNYPPQGYAPQPYTPQYPPQAAPQPYQQPAPVGYPTPQQYAAQPNQGFIPAPAAPPVLPGLARPSAVGAGGGAFPSLKNLEGRLVAFQMTGAINENAVDNNGAATRRATGDLFVLESGTMEYGDAPTKGIPTSHRVDGPTAFRGWSVDRKAIVNQIEKAGSGNALIGRVTSQQPATPGGKPYWYIVPEVGDAADAADALFRELWTKTFGFTVNIGVPVEFRPRPVVAPAAPQGFAQNPNGQGFAQQYSQPQYAQPGVQLNYGQLNALPQGYVPAPQMPQGAPPVDPQYAAWMASQQQAQQVPSAPRPPQGINEAFWNTLSPQQQADLAAQYAGHAGMPAGI